MKSVNALLLGIAIGAIAVGATTAVTAAGNSTITACANKNTGAMRLLTKGSCKKTETRVTWNKEGLQGPKGESAQLPDLTGLAKKSDVVPKTISTGTLPISPLPTTGEVVLPVSSLSISSTEQLVTMSTRSYSFRYFIPQNWVGSIRGSCPDDAPVTVAYGTYATDTNGSRLINPSGRPPFGLYSTDSRADIEFSAGQYASPGMTLYVTQVCAPISQVVSG